MQNGESGLPAGWKVSNSAGSWAAPAAPQELEDLDINDDEAGDELTEEDIRPDSPGWEDVDAEVDETSYKCLLCDDTFSDARKLVEHGKGEHDLDLDKVRKDHSLNFYETIQLINYVREQARLGATSFDWASSAFKDDKYMQPTMEEDALLYSVDELANPDDVDDPLTKEREGDAEEKAVAGKGKGVEGGGGGGHSVVAERALG